MSEIVVALLIWLHSLATVVFIGYFVVLSFIIIPPLAEAESGPQLALISNKSRGWLYAALLSFIATGVFLMFADPEYLGFMDLGNLWGVAMLVKHVLVLLMIGLGFWFNGLIRVGPMMNKEEGASKEIARFRIYINWMTGIGLLVLLLTALAQAQ